MNWNKQLFILKKSLLTSFWINYPEIVAIKIFFTSNENLFATFHNLASSRYFVTSFNLTWPFEDY